jgi:hypothetical protein
MQGRGIGAVAEPVDPCGMPRELVEDIAMDDPRIRRTTKLAVSFQ